MKRVILVLFLIATSVCYATDIENKEEIKVFLSSFKTYKGNSFPQLLESYELRVVQIITQPLESINLGSMKSGDKSEDLIVSIIIRGNAKPMPCGLDIWMSQGIPKDYKYKQEHLAEITTSNGKFRTEYPELDPVLYWAATGKCSSEYNLPSQDANSS